MNEKQKQEVGDNSTAIQVNGNFIYGTPYDQIKTIFIDLFDLNFPKIQEIAKKEADLRLQDLLNNIQKLFLQHQSNINVYKFSDPGIQYEMQQMAINAVRYGKKCNIELLSELFTKILENDCPDTIEQIAGETLKILPLINKKQLSALGVMVLACEAKIENATLVSIDSTFCESMPLIVEVEAVQPADITFLSCVNCLTLRFVSNPDFVPRIIMNIPEYSITKIDDIQKEAEIKALINITRFIDYMKKCKVGNYNLTPIGRLIGWLHLKSVSKVKLEELF